jgi:hypothetical protein
MSTFKLTLTAKNQLSFERLTGDLTQIIRNIASSYFLTGIPGSGKTTVALQIVKAWLQEIACEPEMETNYVTFIALSEIVEKARRSMEDSHHGWELRQQLKDIKEYPLLVIDDVGTEKQTDFILQTIYDIVNFRYENMLQTIFTSNYSLQEIAEKYHDRIASRITEMCGSDNILTLPETDYRSEEQESLATTDFSKLKFKPLAVPSGPYQAQKVAMTEEKRTQALNSFLEGIRSANPKLYEEYVIGRQKFSFVEYLPVGKEM